MPQGNEVFLLQIQSHTVVSNNWYPGIRFMACRFMNKLEIMNTI